MSELTHFADGRPVPMTFTFMFPDRGPVWEKDMTREDLLQVIDYLMRDKEWWRNECMKRKYL